MKSATVIVASLVSCVTLRVSTSIAQRLASGVSEFLMSTVNFFSRRAFSSASADSADEVDAYRPGAHRQAAGQPAGGQRFGVVVSIPSTGRR
jgi:hypothetical protein